MRLVGLAIALVFLTPLTSGAQQAGKVYRIGIIGFRATSDMAGPSPQSPGVKALLRGLNELGYVYGTNFVTEPRGSEGRPERFPGLAADLVRFRVDVILAPGPALPALKQATSTIPVIMTATIDPVGQGFVQSLGRPGRNFTGFSLQSAEAAGKRLELLKEFAPGPAPVAVLWDQSSLVTLRAVEAAARERGWKILPFEIRDVRDLENAFKAAAGARAGSLFVSAAGVLFPYARQVAELAAKSRLPAIYELGEYAEAGGLISYGPDIDDIWRRSAVFVDKVLKGAKPAELPVEQPTKFELVVNLRAAKQLGLTVPPTVLVRADQVIE